MKKSKLLRAAAITVLGLSLGAGVASAAPGDASIADTGLDSYNSVNFDWDQDVDVNNDTDARINNHNPQHASSGDATVWDNNEGGDATSGGASNSSSLTVNASVDNSGSSAALGGGNGGSWSGSISGTGVDSTNRIEFDGNVDVDVDNDTDINIWNDVHQTARSGDARVSHNNSGGSATTGDTSNSSQTEIKLEVTN